jgi:type IV pilus assembly protein PilE
MITRSHGFSLIELLVVVAILGIISAIGISSYSGYVSSTKKKSVENAMLQMNLAQTEYYSMNGSYYPPSGASNSSTTTCTPDDTTSSDIEKVLLGDGSTGPDIITEDLNYHVCIWRKDDQYGLIAEEDTSSKACKITMSNMGTVNREQHC